MKTFVYLLLIGITLCSCGVNDNHYKARIAARESGIVIDSIVQGICFNDSPSEVKRKIKEAEYTYLMKLSYPKSFWYVDWQHYYNDSLYMFSVRTNTNSFHFKEYTEKLDSLYSFKYGKSVPGPKEYDLAWYKGNLTINIYTIEGVGEDYIIICYTDGRVDDLLPKPGEIVKWDNDHNIKYRYTPRLLEQDLPARN